MCLETGCFAMLTCDDGINIIKFFKEADYSSVQREHKEKAPKVKEVKEVKAKPVNKANPIKTV